jgi:hypothetical protein
MSAPALYEADYDVDGVIRVEIADDGPVERVTDVIAQGAEVRRDLYKASSEEHRHRSGVADFLVFVREVVGRDLPNSRAAARSCSTSTLGLIAGAIAKAILPGDDPGGIIVTM